MSSPPEFTTIPSSQDFIASTDAWHKQREQRLVAEDGWLTLVGQSWLSEGDNVAGADPEATVVLPSQAPACLGTFTRRGASVSFSPAESTAVTLGGVPFQGGVLRTDADAAGADVLEVGSLRLYAVDRGTHVGVRTRDTQAAARATFLGVPRYPVDPQWLFEAAWEPTPGRMVAVPNILGEVVERPSPGVAVFVHAGRTHRLTPILGDPEGELFFIFADETNRNETYGGGRFLYAAQARDGKVMLDFNRALNPPCAFSNYVTCPTPLHGNNLALKVTAGEKRYGAY